MAEREFAFAISSDIRRDGIVLEVTRGSEIIAEFEKLPSGAVTVRWFGDGPRSFEETIGLLHAAATHRSFSPGVGMRLLERLRPAWEPIGTATEPFPATYDAIWDRFRAQFAFSPSPYAEHWPSIQEPVNAITYDISAWWSADRSDVARLEEDLNGKLLQAFRQLTAPDERVIVLDWQHIGYFLFPHRPFLWPVSEAWPISILPGGDYYLFVAEDFRFGTFGHPWEQTLCLWGAELLRLITADSPELLSRPVRIGGHPVRDSG